MYRVVVGLDNSAQSATAMRWALDHAARRHAAVTVVGPSGDRGAGFSVEPVLQQASCPVAVGRVRVVDADAPIVVGIDGSATSNAALRWAVDAILTSTRPLVAVHAWHLDAPSAGFVITDDDVARFERVARAELDTVLDEVVDESIAIDSIVLYGSPAAVMLDPDVAPALTVVGRDGASSSGSGPLGSVSDLVASSAPGVVVVVPDTGGER